MAQPDTPRRARLSVAPGGPPRGDAPGPATPPCRSGLNSPKVTGAFRNRALAFASTSASRRQFRIEFLLSSEQDFPFREKRLQLFSQLHVIRFSPLASNLHERKRGKSACKNTLNHVFSPEFPKIEPLEQSHKKLLLYVTPLKINIRSPTLHDQYVMTSIYLVMVDKDSNLKPFTLKRHFHECFCSDSPAGLTSWGGVTVSYSR